jgi:hypothetical protein
MNTDGKIIFAVVLILGLLVGYADSVRVVWEPSPSDMIAGYRIYYGTNSGGYSFCTNVGLRLEQVIELSRRGRWFFAATAVDTNGIESGYSNEVEWEAKPEPPKLTGSLVVRVAPLIERSTNLVHWCAVQGEPTFFAATNAMEFFQTKRLTIERVTQIQTVAEGANE